MRKTGLLIAARRNLGDARDTSISPEARLEATYKAIMQSAPAAPITSASDWQHHLFVASLTIDSVGATWGLYAVRSVNGDGGASFSASARTSRPMR